MLYVIYVIFFMIILYLVIVFEDFMLTEKLPVLTEMDRQAELRGEWLQSKNH